MSRETAAEDAPSVLRSDQDPEIAAFGHWFHNLHLPDGRQTAPDHFLGDFPFFKWQELVPYIPIDLGGWNVLDIGCNAGFYAFELAKRGAKVLGIDSNKHYLKQARWAAAQFGFGDRVEFRHMQVYDLVHRDETFDLILFMGVFYHLRYPLLALDIVAQKVRRRLVFQTLMTNGEDMIAEVQDLHIHDRASFDKPGWPKMAFIENRFSGDPTNWWIANHAGVEAMLRSAGLRVIRRPAHEVYLCEPDPEHPSCIATWNKDEMLSATGQSSAAASVAKREKER